MPFLFLQNWASQQAVQALCWTFIHSLWQGLIAALLAAAIIVCTRRSPALLRYNLLTALLFLFVAGAVVTFGLQWGAAASEVAGTDTPAPGSAATGSVTINTVTTGPQTDEGPWQRFQAYFNEQAPLIVLTWSLFFLYNFIRLLAGLNYVHRLRYTHLEDPAPEWKDRLQQLSHQLGIRQHIELLQSHLVKVPAVLGLLKPVILVPAGLLAGIPPASVEAVLLHELAHIRRKDFGVNLLQSLVELVFFFNPAFMWISALIRQEREACCDDIVLQHTGDKKAYLDALVAFQEATATAPGYAMALANHKTHLLNRVRRMLTQENKRLTIMEKTILLTALIAFSAFAFIPGEMTAQTPPRPAAAPKPLKAARATAPSVPAAPTQPAAASPMVTATAVAPALSATTEAPPATAVAPPPPPTPAAPVGADTVPASKGKYEYKNVTVNTNDNDGQKVLDIQATTLDGKTYRIKKVNGETTEMFLDGKPVPKEQWAQFDELWDDIERRRKRSEEQRARAEQQRAESRRQRETETKARIEQQKARKAQLEQERNTRQQQRRQEASAQKARTRAEVQATQQARSAHKTAKGTTAVGGKNSNRELDIIVNELEARNLITSRDHLSFTLTGDELIVNGKKVDEGVQQRLKERLRLKENDSFQYKKDGGTTTTTVVRN